MRHALAFLTFFILACSHRFQLLSALKDQYLGGVSQDAGLYIWLSQVVHESLSPANWFTLPAFYPYQKTLAWSDNFILPAILIQALTDILSSHIFAYNLCLLLASTLNGYCTYILAMRLYRSMPAALISGAAFLSSTYLTTHLGHPQLQFAFFIPLTISLYLAMENRSSSPAMVLLPLTVLAAFLTAVYYFLFSVLIVAFLVFWSCIGSTYTKRAPRWLSPGGLLIFLTPYAFIIPFVLPYLETSDIFHTRHLYEAQQFAATPLSYLSAGPHSFFYPHTSDFSHSEAWLFPGFLLLLSFALRYLVCAWKQRCLSVPLGVAVSIGTLWLAFVYNSTSILMASGALFWFTLFLLFFTFCRPHSKEWAILNVGVFFMILSFGPLGSEVTQHPPTGPYAALFYFFPGMNALRASGRLGIVMIFTCALSLGSLYLMMRSRYGLFGAVYALLTLPILHYGEQFHALIPLEIPIQKPKAYAFMMTRIHPEDTYLVFPQTQYLTPALEVERWGDFAYHNVNVMNWSLEHDGVPINGYTGLRTHIMKEYPRKLSGFPDTRSVTALSLFTNLRLLVYQGSLVPNFSKKVFLEKLSRYADSFTILYEDEDLNFLIEMTPHTELTTKDAFLLRVPAQPSSELILHLENLEDKKHAVKVFIDKLREEKPYRILTLNPRESKRFAVELPIEESAMAPLVFRLVPDTPSTVLLHERLHRLTK